MSINLNKDLILSISDYEETEMPEPSSRLLEAHMEGLQEWIGYGEIAGLKARGVYFIKKYDLALVEMSSGDYGEIDWDKRLEYCDIITDDGTAVVTISRY